MVVQSDQGDSVIVHLPRLSLSLHISIYYKCYMYRKIQVSNENVAILLTLSDDDDMA